MTAKTKICKKCTIEKTFDSFSPHKKGKHGYNNICKKCCAEKAKIDRKDQTTSYYKAQLKRKERVNLLKEWVKNYKTQKGCFYCKENDECVLDFHHLGEKHFTIGVRIHWGVNLDYIQKEINKCIVICANCHRKLHAGKLIS